MADTCFLVEGREIHGHRAILAIRSEYFRALLFNGHMRESVQFESRTTSGSAPITLSDVSYDVFMKVLEYLYTDCVTDVDLDLGIHLLIASEHFMLDRLKLLCEDIIRRDVSVSNVINILVTSHNHHATGLKELAMEFILSNLNENDIQKGLVDLKSTPELLVEIIQLTSSTSAMQPHSPSPNNPPVAGFGSRMQRPQGSQEARRNVMDQAFQGNHRVEDGGGGRQYDLWRQP